jgi:hypothetical protein
MKKGFAMLAVGIIILVGACHQQAKENCTASVNPNGDSELALLMRQMTAHLEKEKLKMEADDAPGMMPQGFDKILTAKPTDTKQLSENFQEFAKMYLESLKAYHTAKPENYRLAYNNLVKTCISCHSQECPGPVKRIEKLKVAEK